MRLSLLISTAVLSLLACSPLNSPGAGTNNIYVTNFLFTPVIDSGTALKGDTLPVTFNWVDSAAGIPHTIVWDSAPGPLPGDVGAKYSGSQTFVLTPGRYLYHCGLHGNEFGMAGLIVVVPFDTPTEPRVVSSRRSPPVPVITIPKGPKAAQANPPPGARRSQLATS